MMKKRSTKKALLSSILSLVLCLSMLIGTTFAWFTDSVTSSRNTIQSGNLDVKLEYYDTVAKTFKEVDKDVKLFDDEALWEPGYTEVAYLKVSNVGSLALKYQLNVNVYKEILGKTKDGADIRLSDYLVFKVVDIDESVVGTYTRETAMEAAGTVKGLKEYNGETKSLVNTNDANYVALVIYMPTSVGNEANYNGKDVPSIEMGVNLYATQYTSENDSFGQDYDEAAYLPTVYSLSELRSALENGESVKLGDNIIVDETLNVAAEASVTLNLNGMTMTSDSALAGDVEPIIFNRGMLRLMNGTISAVDTTAIRTHGSSAKLTLDNMTISQENATNPEWLGTAVVTSGKSHTVINSGNYSGTSSAAIVATTGGYLTINGGTFEADVTTIRVDSWSYNSFLTINDGTFNVSKTGAKSLYIDGYEKDININGGTFNGTIDSTYTPITINGGNYTKSIKQPGGHQNYYNINAGTFVDNLSVSISNNTKVNGTVTDNGDGTYTVAITAEDLKELVSAGGNVVLGGTIDMKGESVAIPNGTTISGGTIKNARLTSADDNAVSFSNVKFSDAVTVEAKGDGSMNFVDCEFNVTPQKYNGFSRGSAIIGANQYYTLDLYLEGCTFNYQYGNSDPDLWNNAIFMWSAVDSCVIKNCTFNDYGFVGIKLMNAAEGAEIVFENNTFNMSKKSAANWYHNNAVQVMPQHDRAMTVKFINNTFVGDYEDDTIVATIEVMYGGTLTNLTFEQSENNLNGQAVTNANFAITAE